MALGIAGHLGLGDCRPPTRPWPSLHPITIPIDLLFNPGSDQRLHCPEGVKDHWDLFTHFIRDSHEIAITLLENLSDSLGLHSNERFEVYHKANHSSTSTTCLQYYPFKDLPPNTSVGHFTHTDTGSITILFNSDWGLQGFSPACDAWEYVAPRPDCAIVNVGDALKFISGFRLKSSLHRVVPWNGTWTKSPRYATIFFLRPNDDTEFVDSEGVRWTAAAWLRRKFQNYRFSHKQQETNAISTGRKGFSGLVETAAATP